MCYMGDTCELVIPIEIPADEFERFSAENSDKAKNDLATKVSKHLIAPKILGLSGCLMSFGIPDLAQNEVWSQLDWINQ